MANYETKKRIEYFCLECNEEIDDIDAATLHVKQTKHTVDVKSVHVCICGETFDRATGLFVHIVKMGCGVDE